MLSISNEPSVAKVEPIALNSKGSTVTAIAKTIARLISSLFGKTDAWDTYEAELDKKSLFKAIAQATVDESNGKLNVDSKLGKFAIEHNPDTNAFAIKYGGIEVVMPIVGSSINSFKELQSYCNNYLSLINQGIPDRHTAPMLSLMAAVENKDLSQVQAGITQLTDSVNEDGDLKHANVTVTCNSMGNLVLEAHLAYENDSNPIIELGTIREDFYADIHKTKNSDDSNSLVDLSRLIEKNFATDVQNWINGIKDFNPKTVGSWKVQNFFDLACQYQEGNFKSIEPNFHLDLLGSGELSDKYNKSADEKGDHAFHEKPPVLFKKDSQRVKHGAVEKAHVIEGPSGLLGDRFDANVIEGFCTLLDQIAKGKTNLHISGHSRGGVEAIAINNLLVLLKKASNEEGLEIDQFITSQLKKIKANPDDFLPIHLKGKDKTVATLIQNAININKLANVKIGLTLADPVQGPDHTVFYHKAFDLSKTLMLDEDMHSQVDIVMGSHESTSIGFDIHLPEVQLPENSKIKLAITKVHCSHGSMIKELYRKKSKGVYNGEETGSVQAHFAMSVLTGRADQIQHIDHIRKFQLKQERKLVPSYANRGKIYAAGSMIKQTKENPWLQNLSDSVANFMKRPNVIKQTAEAA